MASGLLDMPEDVMSKIMEGIGIKAILTLREVCHDLRNFIDDAKPNANLIDMKIDVEGRYCISFEYTCCEEDHLAYKTWYLNQKGGCLVENAYECKTVMLKNEDFITVSMKYIGIVLRHQKSLLKRLDVLGRRHANVIEDLAFKEHFERIFKSRVHPLKVEFFNAQFNQNQLMSILPFLDSKTLKKVKISNLDDDLEVDQLVKLDQWKNVQHMDLSDCYVDYKYIQHFTHFSTDYIKFKSAHFPDLGLLKDMYLQSSRFQKIWIDITRNCVSDDLHRSTESLGPFHLNLEDVEMSWYYRIPATNQILCICVINFVQIQLSRIDESKVPHGAVIQN